MISGAAFGLESALFCESGALAWSVGESVGEMLTAARATGCKAPAAITSNKAVSARSPETGLESSRCDLRSIQESHNSLFEV